MTISSPTLLSIVEALDRKESARFGVPPSTSDAQAFRLTEETDLNYVKKELKVQDSDTFLASAVKSAMSNFGFKAICNDAFDSPEKMHSALKESFRESARQWHRAVDPEIDRKRMEQRAVIIRGRAPEDTGLLN